MLSVRLGVFETNSSSVHAFCLLSPEKMDEFRKLDNEVMVSYEVPEKALEKLGLEYLKTYPAKEIIDKLKENKDIENDLEVYFYDDDYSLKNLFYAGFWSPKGMDDSYYQIIETPMKTPNDEDVFVLEYVGYS